MDSNENDLAFEQSNEQSNEVKKGVLQHEITVRRGNIADHEVNVLEYNTKIKKVEGDLKKANGERLVVLLTVVVSCCCLYEHEKVTYAKERALERY